MTAFLHYFFLFQILKSVGSFLTDKIQIKNTLNKLLIIFHEGLELRPITCTVGIQTLPVILISNKAYPISMFIYPPCIVKH